MSQPSSDPYSSILAKRGKLTASEFSASLCFGLLGLQGFTPVEGLDKVLVGILREGLQQLSGYEMGLIGTARDERAFGRRGT
jgi:hypothetical protein